MQLLVLVIGGVVVAVVTWLATSWWQARYRAEDDHVGAVVVEQPAGQSESV